MQSTLSNGSSSLGSSSAIATRTGARRDGCAEGVSLAVEGWRIRGLADVAGDSPARVRCRAAGGAGGGGM